MAQAFSRTILFAIFGSALAVAGADAFLYYRDFIGAEQLMLVWSVVFSILIATWVDADSRGHPNVYRPYEFGFLVYLVWPIYLPYYLIQTRGATGLLWLGALAAAFLLSSLCRLVIWYGA